MATTSSFDVTTGVDMMEVNNAVDQATKEVSQRYDFKGHKIEIVLDEKAGTITLSAPDDYKLTAVWEVLQGKMVKRKVPVQNLTRGTAESAAGSSLRQVVTLTQGLSSDLCREIVRYLKDLKLKKVQSAIQGDTVRISSASKDDLQGAMAILRGHDFGVELKFGNFRTNG